MTLHAAEAASAEALLQRWERSEKSGEAVEMTSEEARWFNEILRLAYACPGCGGMPGEYHADGCPCDAGTEEA